MDIYWVDMSTQKLIPGCLLCSFVVFNSFLIFMSLHNVELNKIFVDVTAFILFYMHHTPSKEDRNKKKTITEGVYTLIQESFTIAQNTQ